MDPTTPKEWQEAVDAAHFFIALDSARQYGLVKGGPNADLERCEEILQRGREQGITPQSDALDRGVAELLAEQKKKKKP